ncbi:hypothetical protein ACOMHN_065553 [Nucella lapillus]
MVLLQLLIILTGNYNFFNLLTITLCFPLLDDEAFFGPPRKAAGVKKGMAWNLLSLLASILVPGVVLGVGAYYTIKLFNLRLTPQYTVTSKIGWCLLWWCCCWWWCFLLLVLVLGVGAYYTIKLFNLRLMPQYTVTSKIVLVLGVGAYYTIKLLNLRITPQYTVTSKIDFTEKQFLEWLDQIMPLTIKLGAASLALELLQALIRSFTSHGGILWKNFFAVQSLLFGALAAAMFGVSLVPHTALHKPLQRSLDPKILTLHGQTRPFHIVASYGLFRRMTGVGGRPEVVIEGSHDRDGGWKEYNFLYKPGNLSARPPVVAPHQPRLDWQMWFAALSNYQNNPWFVTLLYRLLTAQPEVTQLMGHNPFPHKPPKYVRATLYHYHYTATDPKKKGYSAVNWWTRTKHTEYVPVMSADMPALQEFLKHYRVLEAPPKKPKKSQLGDGVKWIRHQVGQPEGFLFVMSTFASGLLISAVNALLF